MLQFYMGIIFSFLIFAVHNFYRTYDSYNGELCKYAEIKNYKEGYDAAHNEMILIVCAKENIESLHLTYCGTKK